MLSNPNLVHYACIAKGKTILAEFSSKEPGIELLACKCIEKTPPYHSMFSHTVGARTYVFLIHEPLAYFAIFDETLDKSESMWLLNRMKCAFEELAESGSIKGFDDDGDVFHNCFQSQFDPIFGEIMAMDLDMMDSSGSMAADSRNPSLDSTKGRRTSIVPLLGKQLKVLKKKKRLSVEANGDGGFKDAGVLVSEKKLDMGGDDVNGMLYTRDLKNGLLHGGGDHHHHYHHRQKAKQIWRKHVWVVLILDLLVCAVLFGIWLWVCRGFQCIDG
ncbi:phytolongin Phyl2.2 [Carica papaya]|uniref:phytolongin Phyl2.2 n=1 Tax=Carica papaya TaxID=3649 RepID=UPI000B8CE8B1|nr:phytolongin Phyl2.2 [Carica papaya]